MKNFALMLGLFCVMSSILPAQYVPQITCIAQGMGIFEDNEHPDSELPGFYHHMRGEGFYVSSFDVFAWVECEYISYPVSHWYMANKHNNEGGPTGRFCTFTLIIFPPLNIGDGVLHVEYSAKYEQISAGLTVDTPYRS